MGLGGFFGGYFYDLTGDYYTSFAFAAVMGVINLIVLVLFNGRINRSRRALELIELNPVARTGTT